MVGKQSIANLKANIPGATSEQLIIYQSGKKWGDEAKNIKLLEGWAAKITFERDESMQLTVEL